MYTIWSQIRNVFSCTKQPLEEIVTPIVNIEEFVSVTDINEIKERDPIIYEQTICYENETKMNNVPDAESEFEEYKQYELDEENEIEKKEYHDLPDLIFVDNEEYDSYDHYATDDEEDDYYRH
jgi:hypothetical protein